MASQLTIIQEAEIWGIGSVWGVQSCKIVFLGALPIHLFRHFCYRMHRLVTTHSVTDRRTDGQTDNIIMTIVDHTACSTIV